MSKSPLSQLASLGEDMIGRAVSNGCIRVRNDDLRRLFRLAVAGTPVEIRA